MNVLRDEMLSVCGLKPSDGVLIALSGGADSVALLLESFRWKEENKIAALAAAHFHHGIRGVEADRDAAFCRDLCNRLAIPYYEGRADIPSLAKEKGLKTLSIVNVVGSSIARESDHVMYTLAGPEISVATTKAYSCQLICGYLLALKFAEVRGTIESPEKLTYYIDEIKSIPEKMKKILDEKERIQWFAAKFANAHDIFFIGRGIDYAISLEGSLKMKEISYIHSEAYAAGELKHGTISLIENGTLVIGVLTQPALYEKTISNMVECQSRGAYLMGLTTYGRYNVEDQVDFTVYIPKVDEHFVGSLAIIPLQLLGYYTSVAKGLDVDKPRNLAKSVTVE